MRPPESTLRSGTPGARPRRAAWPAGPEPRACPRRGPARGWIRAARRAAPAPSGQSSSSSRNESSAADPRAPGAGAPPEAAESATPSGQPSVADQSASSSAALGSLPVLACISSEHSSGLNARSAVPRRATLPVAWSFDSRSGSSTRAATATRSAGGAGQQVAHHGAGVGRVGELLGVVDHDRQRVPNSPSSSRVSSREASPASICSGA